MLDLNTDEYVPKEVLQSVAKRLHAVINSNRTLNRSLVQNIESIITDETVRIRKAGFHFPDLKVVYFESVGWVEIVRADLEAEGIERVVTNVIQRFPNIDVRQLVVSIHRAFPHYHKDDGMAEALRAGAAIEAKLRGEM